MFYSLCYTHKSRSRRQESGQTTFPGWSTLTNLDGNLLYHVYFTNFSWTGVIQEVLPINTSNNHFKVRPTSCLIHGRHHPLLGLYGLTSSETTPHPGPSSPPLHKPDRTPPEQTFPTVPLDSSRPSRHPSVLPSPTPTSPRHPTIPSLSLRH